MQAIEVKIYCDPNGNMKVKAFCQAKTKLFYQDEIRQEIREKNYPDRQEFIAIVAAKRLATFLGWNDSKYYGSMVIGELKNGNYVITFTGKDNANVIYQ